MDEARLPTHLEANALIRLTQAEGGFATVIRRGDREAGTLLVLLCENGANARAYERMPQANGARVWRLISSVTPENKQELSEYLTRRAAQDGDLWIIELDIARAERLIGLREPSR